MARPAKATGARVGHDTKEIADARRECEDAMRGNGKGIRAPKHLNPNQKLIFKRIVKELEASEILGNLDVYILATAAIAIDRLDQIETEINQNPEKISDDGLMRAKEKYAKDFYRCCNELCLSPQARAKMSAAAAEKRKGPSSLAMILGGESG